MHELMASRCFMITGSVFKHSDMRERFASDIRAKNDQNRLRFAEVIDNFRPTGIFSVYRPNSRALDTRNYKDV